ncbi:MAG: tRNA 2-thiocytidine biosynthesis protein TtcA [Firmicutes bacterium]|nr:tRNA 2-thiocytidine biosynthesis protein TtcA [Bacillota bacterium]
MQPQLPRKISRIIWRALMEFSMLGPGDRCLVGLSGGKDSAFLLYALAALKLKAPFQFDLAAVTIDPMFDPNFPAARIQELCDQLGVPLFLERTNLAAAAFAPSNQNPCSRCAYLRRGALNRIAKREGYNRLALAHHHDDAVETFLMSILYAGQIKTFGPVTWQDRSGLLVIRPLIYLREAQIRATRSFFDWEPVPTGCPLDGKSTRQRVKDLLCTLETENPVIYSNLSAAMRLPLTEIELWPPELTREEMRSKYRQVLSK